LWKSLEVFVFLRDAIFEDVFQFCLQQGFNQASPICGTAGTVSEEFDSEWFAGLQCRFKFVAD